MELFTLLRFAPAVQIEDDPCLASGSQANYRDCVTTRPPALSATIDDALAADLAQLRACDRERSLRQVWNRRGAVVQTKQGTAVDFSSNDYLGLASDPRIAAAATESIARMGVGAGAARLISGNTPEHDALDEDIAHWFGAERALSFSTGYAANVGTISALVGRGDVIFSDALNHASVIDGCRLSRATVHIYPHADVDALAALLDRHRASARRALIVTDGLFSMDGDAAPIADIVDLARRFDAWSYVDDAHAAGVVGPDGLGTAAAAGVHGEVDVTVGTLGKSFGAAGAFVYGSDVLARYLMNTARSFIFSTAMIPAQAAAAREALRIARAEPERRERLLENAKRLGHHERSEGSGHSISHIIPLMIGDDARTMQIGAALAERGFLVGAIRPPTVPVGTARLRITATAAHTDEQIAGLGAALSRALRT